MCIVRLLIVFQTKAFRYRCQESLAEFWMEGMLKGMKDEIQY